MANEREKEGEANGSVCRYFNSSCRKQVRVHLLEMRRLFQSTHPTPPSIAGRLSFRSLCNFVDRSEENAGISLAVSILYMKIRLLYFNLFVSGGTPGETKSSNCVLGFCTTSLTAFLWTLAESRRTRGSPSLWECGL